MTFELLELEKVKRFVKREIEIDEELQEENPAYPVDAEWACDSVTCEEVEEFSQKYLGEQIIDHYVVDENAIIDTFDRDNDYLKEWTREQKLEHIRCLYGL